MGMKKVPEYGQFILNEDLLTEADTDAQQGYDFEYTYLFGGSRFNEAQFKQKLILTIKSLKSISTFSAIPEAVNIIVAGLKEGAEVKGIALFELGGTPIQVRAKKVVDQQTEDDSNM